MATKLCHLYRHKHTLIYIFWCISWQVGPYCGHLSEHPFEKKPKTTDFKTREQEAPFCPIYLCLSVVHLVGLDGLAAGLAAVIDHCIELGPGPELPLPVWDGGKWGNDQEWPLNALHVNLIEECNGLDGLS